MTENLASLAGQILVAGFADTSPDRALLADTEKGLLGGIVLFKRNIGAMAEVSHLVAAYANAAPKALPMLVSIDQEGGRVARLGPPVVKLPPMRRLASLGDTAFTERAGAVLGAQLGALGITMDFAPVLDVDTNPDNPVIGDRAFGSTARAVIEHGLAFGRGLESAHVLSCGKHFPGHGDTETDSHFVLPRVKHDRPRLDAIELAPFAAARGKLSSIMTAHVVFDALDDGVPATLSHKVVTELLRGQLGFDGVVFSDDLEMKALADRYGIVDSAVAAVRAGCDALLVCSNLDWLAEARDGLARAADDDPSFRERLVEARRRFVAMRQRAAPSPITDPVALDRALKSDAVRSFEAELARRA